MQTDEKDNYFIAVKVFLEKEGKFLIFKDGFGQWDIPGGRIKKSEFNVPLEQIVARKLSEELGDNIKYGLGKPILFMRHERIESTPGNPTVRIFAIGYQAVLKEGEICMTSHHTELLWADPMKINPNNYFIGGWLKGVQEYIEWHKAGKI